MPLGEPFSWFTCSHQLENPTVHPCSGFRLGVREWRAVVRPRELTHEHSCAVLENHRAEKKRTRINHFRMPNKDMAAMRRKSASSRKKRKLSKKTIAKQRPPP